MDQPNFEEVIRYKIQNMIFPVVLFLILSTLAYLYSNAWTVGFIAFVFVVSSMIRLTKKYTVSVQGTTLTFVTKNETEIYPLKDIVEIAPCFFFRDFATPIIPKEKKETTQLKQMKSLLFSPCKGGVMFRLSSGKTIAIPSRRSDELLKVIQSIKK